MMALGRRVVVLDDDARMAQLLARQLMRLGFDAVAPRSVSASEAFDASFTSPPPVKPDPWKNSERPMPV